MLTVVLPDDLESAVVNAASSLDVDRARLDSYFAGAKMISDSVARAWLTELMAGNRTECPIE